MNHDPKFGPAAQTPEQRAWVLNQMQEAIPTLKRRLNAHVRQLHARYVAGELSWTQMRQAMESAAND